MKKEGPGLPSIERATSSPIRALSSSGGPRWKGRQSWATRTLQRGSSSSGLIADRLHLQATSGRPSPPISDLAGHGNNASKVGHSPTIDFLERLPSRSRYHIFLKH